MAHRGHTLAWCCVPSQPTRTNHGQPSTCARDNNRLATNLLSSAKPNAATSMVLANSDVAMLPQGVKYRRILADHASTPRDVTVSSARWGTPNAKGVRCTHPDTYTRCAACCRITCNAQVASTDTHRGVHSHSSLPDGPG